MLQKTLCNPCIPGVYGGILLKSPVWPSTFLLLGANLSGLTVSSRPRRSGDLSEAFVLARLDRIPLVDFLAEVEGIDQRYADISVRVCGGKSSCVCYAFIIVGICFQSNICLVSEQVGCI